jgi:hypothetical protein
MIMPITPSDIGGDDDTARRVLVQARTIAPCIDTFTADSEAGKNAIAVLRGVLAELPAPGSARTTSMSRNGTSVSFARISSAFEGDATVQLRALCGATQSLGHSVGSFPVERAFERVWPEEGGYT